MIALEWQADIAASADDVFSLLVELRDYDQWLPGSSAYHGTSRISDGPIVQGTTYTEPGPFGIRHGRITRLRRPTELDFEQPMTMRPSFLGVIAIRLFHRIEARADAVHLLRRLEVTPQGPIRFAAPLLVRSFEAENRRMMRAVTQAAEAKRVAREAGFAANP